MKLKSIIHTLWLLTALATAPAMSTTYYELSGTFTDIAMHDFEGSGIVRDDSFRSGSLTLGGYIQTDTDAPGYTITGGAVTLQADINVHVSVPILGDRDATITFDLIDGVPSDAGVVFTSGNICISLAGSSCFISLEVGTDNVESIDFSSEAIFQGETITGLRLSGGAGGESFSIAQPGGVTPVLGPDTDLRQAVGFTSVGGAFIIVNYMFDLGFFVNGDLTFTQTDNPEPPPNIVVVQVDDLSTDMFEALLSDDRLPNIAGSLMETGITFENSYVTTPEGSPSRATLLTGQYAHNHGVYSNQTPRALEGGITWDGWLPSGEDTGREGSTLATWLQSVGYRTGFIGKYLTGYGQQAPAGVSEPAQYIPAGWDDWQGLVGDSANRMFDYSLNDNGTLVTFGHSEAEYQTDVLASKAADFINTTEDTSFFLLVAPGAARVEITDPIAFVTGNDPLAPLALSVRPAARHAHLIDGDDSNGELADMPTNKPSFNAPDLTGKASCPRPLPPVAPALVTDPFCTAEAPLLGEANIDALSSQYKASQASMLAVDDLVGTIVSALESTEKLDNTVIVFTSDNGRMWGEHRLFDRLVAYEEAIRVPLLIRAPEGRVNATESGLVANNDLAPTLAELAGAVPAHEPDGTSLVPLIVQSPETPWQEREHLLIAHWYMDSLLKHDAPTYLAWRGKSDDVDFTYIATRALAETHDFFGLDVSSRELYTLDSDQHQQSSIELPEDVGDYLDVLVRIFGGCAAEACRDIEIPGS